MKPTVTAVRLNPGWREILDELAARDGCSVSDMIRRALIREYRLPIRVGETVEAPS